MRKNQLHSILMLGLLVIFLITASPSLVLAQKGTPVVSNPPSVVELRNPVLREKRIVQMQNPTVQPMIQQPTQTPYYIVVTATPQQPSYTYQQPVRPRKAFDCAVNVNKPYFYELMYPGQDFDFDVTFTNTGTATWTTDVDVQQYTGWRMEIDGKYVHDIDKDYDEARHVRPGESIRWKVRMEAPKDQSSETDKYFSTYYLVNGVFDNNIEETYSRLFCPFSVYIYVPR